MAISRVSLNRRSSSRLRTWCGAGKGDDPRVGQVPVLGRDFCTSVGALDDHRPMAGVTPSGGLESTVSATIQAHGPTG